MDNQKKKTKQLLNLEIYTYQNKLLRQVAEPLTLEEIDQITKKEGEWYDRVEGMKEVLRKIGVGLAAPQVGFGKRLFIYFPHKLDKKQIEVIINPTIETITDKNVVMGFEGCLSIPRIGSYVPRPYGAKVQFVIDTGQRVTAMVSGHECNVFLHEFDHLNGIWFIDRGFNRNERRKFKKKTGVEVLNIGSKERYLTPE